MEQTSEMIARPDAEVRRPLADGCAGGNKNDGCDIEAIDDEAIHPLKMMLLSTFTGIVHPS